MTTDSSVTASLPLEAGATQDLSVEPWGSTLLLISDQPADVQRIARLLEDQQTGQFHMTQVGTVAQAMDVLGGQDFSAILLDLSLSEIRGDVEIETLRSVVPRVPIVVLGVWDVQERAVRAMRAGADDFLMKHDLDTGDLNRSLSYAIERKFAERRLEHLTRFDQLTQLGNRAYFQERLEQALVRVELAGEQVALLYIDIDHRGDERRPTGAVQVDKFVFEVAERLRQGVRDSETVARVNDNAFCVILESIASVAEANAVAGRIRKSLAEPYGARRGSVRVRVGVAISGGDAQVERLLEEAEFAATLVSTECAAPLGGQPDRSQQERVIDALERGEFLLMYQPRVNMDRGAYTAVEAFLRWDTPDLGLLRPAQFMSALQEADLLLAVSDWVVQQAAQQARQWRQDGLLKMRMAVNLSRPQFERTDAVAHLEKFIVDGGGEPDWFEFDIAESLLMDNPARSRMVLKAMQARGMHTAVDDFGTGLGHIAEMARLPIDVLKIDRSIVADADEQPSRRALVAAAVALGRELAFEVVAEGVERESQVELLRALGATSVQGFWLVEPKSASGFTEWCRRERLVE